MAAKPNPPAPRYSLADEAQAKAQLPINLLALSQKLGAYGVTVELGGKTARRTADPESGHDLPGCEGFQKVEFSGPIGPRNRRIHHGRVDKDYRAFVEAKSPEATLAGKLVAAGAAHDSHQDHHHESEDIRRVWYYEHHPVEINAFVLGLIAAL